MSKPAALAGVLVALSLPSLNTGATVCTTGADKTARGYVESFGNEAFAGIQQAFFDMLDEDDRELFWDARHVPQ